MQWQGVNWGPLRSTQIPYPFSISLAQYDFKIQFWKLNFIIFFTLVISPPVHGYSCCHVWSAEICRYLAAVLTHLVGLFSGDHTSICGACIHICHTSWSLIETHKLGLQCSPEVAAVLMHVLAKRLNFLSSSHTSLYRWLWGCTSSVEFIHSWLSWDWKFLARSKEHNCSKTQCLWVHRFWTCHHVIERPVF